MFSMVSPDVFNGFAQCSQWYLNTNNSSRTVASVPRPPDIRNVICLVKCWVLEDVARRPPSYFEGASVSIKIKGTDNTV